MGRVCSLARPSLFGRRWSAFPLPRSLGQRWSGGCLGRRWGSVGLGRLLVAPVGRQPECAGMVWLAVVWACVVLLRLLACPRCFAAGFVLAAFFSFGGVGLVGSGGGVVALFRCFLLLCLLARLVARSPADPLFWARAVSLLFAGLSPAACWAVVIARSPADPPAPALSVYLRCCPGGLPARRPLVRCCAGGRSLFLHAVSPLSPRWFATPAPAQFACPLLPRWSACRVFAPGAPCVRCSSVGPAGAFSASGVLLLFGCCSRARPLRWSGLFLFRYNCLTKML